LIGNDLIDLEIPMSNNWNTSRYLNKLYTTAEQKYISEAQDPQLILQLFWSLKEAAYKAHQRRLDLPRSYNPLEFSCEIISEDNSETTGSVFIGNSVYHTISIITKQYIHSVASFDNPSNFISKIFDAEIDIKQELLLAYSKITQQEFQLLSVQKNAEQIPFFYRNKTKLHVDFSLSHHGKFSAFVLALTNS